MPRIATSLFAYGPGIMLCSKTRRGIPACYDCLVYHFLRVASNICTSIHHTCFYCQLIYFLAHGNKFSVYIFLTAQINMSLFTNDVSLTITPCYPSFSNVPASGCVSVFALTEYDTPKKKDKICRQTTTAFQRNSVLQGFDGYAPCSAV